MGTISFDRAAGYYDATRSLPEPAQAALADVLAAELSGRGTCLEIGVGTGRIALPLHERGIRLVGMDVAPAMMARLEANAGGRRPFPLLLADATRLPFVACSVGAVLASHVLHLVTDWQTAVEEAMRVLRPEGALLVDFGGRPQTPWSGYTEQVLHRHGVFQVRPGASSHEQVADYLGDRAEVRPLPAVGIVIRRALAQDLDEWERQVHAWTWPYTQEQVHDSCAEIRAWATSGGWPLDRVVDLERDIQWWVFQRCN